MSVSYKIQALTVSCTPYKTVHCGSQKSQFPPGTVGCSTPRNWPSILVWTSMEPVAVSGQQIHAHFSYASSHCSQLSFILTSFVLLQSVPRCPFSCSLLMCFFILFLGVLFHAHFSYASSYCSYVSFSMLTSHVVLHAVPRCPDPCSLLIYFFILFVGVLFHSHFSFASSFCSMLTCHMLLHTVHKCPFHAHFSCFSSRYSKVSCSMLTSYIFLQTVCRFPCSFLICFFIVFLGVLLHAQLSCVSSYCS